MTVTSDFIWFDVLPDRLLDAWVSQTTPDMDQPEHFNYQRLHPATKAEDDD